MNREEMEEMAGIVSETLKGTVEETVKEAVKAEAVAIKEEVLGSVDKKIAAKEESPAVISKSEKDFEAGDVKDALEGVDLMAKFIRGVFTKDEAMVKEAQGASTKAMGELTGANGGFLVPEELIAEIWRIQELQGLARAQARIVNMSRETMNINRIGSNVTSYWAGHTIAMTESSPTIEQITLVAESLTGMSMFENELLADEDGNIVSEVTQLFAEVMATEEDDEMFNGTGAPFIGILNDADVTVVDMTTADNTFEELIPADLRKLVYSISSKALKNAAWYMSPYAWHVVQTLLQDSKFLSTFANPMMSKGAWKPEQITDSAGTIWGYPVFLTDALPGSADTAASTKWIVFGNMQYFVVGERSGMEAKVSTEGYVGTTSLFETNQSAIRLVKRVAMSVGIPEAFAILKTAAAT